MQYKVVAVLVTVLPKLKNLVARPNRVEKKLKRGDTKQVFTAVVVVTNRSAAVVMTVLFKPVLKMSLIMVNLVVFKIGPMVQVKK